MRRRICFPKYGSKIWIFRFCLVLTATVHVSESRQHPLPLTFQRRKRIFSNNTFANFLESLIWRALRTRQIKDFGKMAVMLMVFRITDEIEPRIFDEKRLLIKNSGFCCIFNP